MKQGPLLSTSDGSETQWQTDMETYREVQISLVFLTPDLPTDGGPKPITKCLTVVPSETAASTPFSMNTPSGNAIPPVTWGGWDGKESASNVGDQSSIPGLGRSPGGEHGNPL